MPRPGEQAAAGPDADLVPADVGDLHVAGEAPDLTGDGRRAVGNRSLPRWPRTAAACRRRCRAGAGLEPIQRRPPPVADLETVQANPGRPDPGHDQPRHAAASATVGTTRTPTPAVSAARVGFRPVVEHGHRRPGHPGPWCCRRRRAGRARRRRRGAGRGLEQASGQWWGRSPASSWTWMVQRALATEPPSGGGPGEGRSCRAHPGRRRPRRPRPGRGGGQVDRGQALASSRDDSVAEAAHPGLSPRASASAWPMAMPVSSTVWWASTSRSRKRRPGGSKRAMLPSWASVVEERQPGVGPAVAAAVQVELDGGQDLGGAARPGRSGAAPRSRGGHRRSSSARR